jgi:glycosyltransferase involved in cell wall biosynthesis
MRLVLVSTHVDQTTGYSKVAYNLLKQLATLAPKVKTYHFGFQRHPAHQNIRKVPEGIIAYDAAANEDPKEEGFGFNKIHEYLETVTPDVVLIYNDPLIISKMIEAMKHKKGESSYKLWLYVDQVYEGIAKPLVELMNSHADRIYCFTPKWRDTYLKYGEFPQSEVRVLGHAVDPATFTSLPANARVALRQKLNIPNDAIVFMNANRNSQRKRLDLTIAGFARLLKNNPDKELYLLLVTTMNPQAGAYYDVQRIFLEEVQELNLDIQKAVPKLLAIDSSVPNIIGDDFINQLYNVADIGINTSDGEGYGLCQLEHMYTGAPQVVTDVGSYSTFLTPEVSEIIPRAGKVYFPGGMPLGLYSPHFSVDEVSKAMETMIGRLPDARKAVADYAFKSWASVCDDFLGDVLTESTNGSS